MNVATAVHLFSYEVSASLKYMVTEMGRSQDYLTTAWFIELIDRWFYLLSSRHPASALSMHHEDAYTYALDHLKAVIEVTNQLQIGEKAQWKPVQAGIILSTTAS